LNSTKRPESLDAWLALLEGRHPRAIDLGLERCGAVWRRMGGPRPAPSVFIVAGTNGKGSTAATICGLLGGLGHRYGSYTTPHIHRYNERIQIQGQPVGDALLLAAFERVEAARRDTSLTYFEFGTLAAFQLLADARLDHAVMEVGLGGRLDAVNLLDADVAVITPIGLDHQEYLGDDLESIAREKAGVIRPAQTVICGERDPPSSLLSVAQAANARLLRLGVDFQAQRVAGGVRFIQESRFPAPASGGRRLRSTASNKRTTPLVPLTRCGIPSALLRLRRNRTSSIACASLDLPNRGRRVARGSSSDIDLLLPKPALAGPHQVANMATALAAVLARLPEAAEQVAALGRGLRSVRLPGRLERVSARPAVWLDVGHNPMAARAIAEALLPVREAEGIRTWRCVLAMLSDKDAAGAADGLRPLVTHWYCAGLPGSRGQTGAQLAARIEKGVGTAPVGVYESVQEALHAALADSASDDGVLVFGSFLTVAAAAPRFAGRSDSLPPADTDTWSG